MSTSTTVTEGNNANVTLGNGNYTVDAGNNDVIKVGNGSDTVTGGTGDTVSVGNGNDTISLGSESSITAGNGNDTLTAGDGSSIRAGNGTDTITAGNASSVQAGNGNDTITVGSDSTVKAGNGNDTIQAGSHSVVVVGNGNDTIYMGASDTVTVGNGTDKFILPTGSLSLTAPNSLTLNEDTSVSFDVNVIASDLGFGQEIIYGFSAASDQLVFNTAQFANAGAVLASARQVGQNTVITADAADTVTLENVKLSSLSAKDFAFVSGSSAPSVQITISGLPAGVTLSDNSGPLQIVNGSITLMPAQLAGLTLSANDAGSATLTITAINTVTGASMSKQISLTVNEVATAPNLSAPHALSVNEGGTIALGISASAIEADQNTPSILIRGVPADALLSAGINNHNGTWTLTAAQLNGLQFTAGEEGTATLTVTATDTEVASTASATRSISLTINPPTINVMLAGTAQEGAVLTANAIVSNGDAVGFQWQSSADGHNWTPISGATSQTYTVQEADENSQIRAVATLVDDGYSVASAATSKVVDAAPAFASGPTISGVAQEGQTLTASATPTQSDNTVTYQWQANGTNISGASAATYLVQEGDEGKTIDVVATITNENNVTTSKASDPIKVQDTTPPVITGQANETVEATGPSGAAVSFSATASDIVDGSDPVVFTENGHTVQSGTTFAIGTHTITETATDTHNNTSTTSFTITVQDTTPPVITGQANETIEATGPSGAAVSFSATVTDIVDGSDLVVFKEGTNAVQSGAVFALGTHTITETATDAVGNSSTTNFTITVQDTTPPVITGQANETVEATGPSGAAVSFSATASDIVDGSDLVVFKEGTNLVQSGAVFALGTHTIPETATDTHNNTSTTSFTITVQDTTPPVITGQANETIEATGPSGAAVSFSATATDIVDGSDLVVFKEGTNAVQSGAVFALGTHTITETATDTHNNTSTTSFTITVQDTTPPVITGQANETVEATGPSGAAVSFSATATDIVDGSDLVVFTENGPTVQSGTTFAIGTHTITETATDTHNNTSTTSFTIKVQDTTPPSITFDSAAFINPVGGTGTVSNDGRVTLSGTTQDNVTVSQVEVLNAGVSLGLATVDNITHAWTLATNLTQGTYNSLHATATDESGNTSDAPTTAVLTVSPQTGYGLDGYIAGATVFADSNGDGIFESTEASGITDQFGHFVLGPGTTSGPLVLIGGTDSATGLAFSGVLTAPAGSTQVTPLTTLVQSVAATTGNVSAASQAVAQALGIDPSVDLTSLDTVAAAYAGNSQAFVAASSVLNTVSMVASAVAGTGASDFLTAASNAFAALASQIVNLPANSNLNLTDPGVVSSTLASVAPDPATLTADQISAIVAVVTSVNAVTNQVASNSADPQSLLTNVSAAAIVAQGTASTQLQQATSDPTNNSISDVVSRNTGDNLTSSVASAQVGSVAPAPPQVLGLNPTDPTPTNSTLVHYTMAFSDPVQAGSVNTSDFNLVTTGLTGASISSITPNSAGTQFTIAIDTGIGDGTVALSFTPGTTVVDLAGRSLQQAQSTFAGPTYTVDPDNFPATLTTPVISGVAQEGQTLTATAAVSNDDDATVTYQWQADHGSGFVNIVGASGLSYVVGEADENATLRIIATSIDSDGSGTTTTSAATAAVVDNSSITVAAISALNGVVQGQQLSATATITGDADDAGATISYQWQVSSDGGTTWSNTGPATSGSASNVPASFYQLTEADEGMLVRVVASFTDDSGQVVSAASAATVVVAEIAPVITVPFSYAVDELMIVKNGTQMFDDTFASAPPFATPVTDPAGSAPVNFATLGSTWSDINSKAIMASSGAALIGGGAQVIARFNTNTQPQGSGAGQSELGLKQDAAFTVSGKFDLSAPSPVNAFYGIDLTDGSPSRNPADQVVQLVLKKTSTTGGGTYAVQLIQNNQATNTVNILAQQDITAQMAGNTQIEFDLSHAANGTAITGAFELFNNGTQTAATTFAPTGTIFTNGVTYTRAEILAFAPQAATISGLAQDGQTLTANAATNDADAVLHYQWQFSTNGGGTWTAIAGAADAKTYTLQESDEGHQIRVAVNSTDADGNTSATVTSGATSGVTDQPTTITNLLVNGVSAGLQPHEGDTLTATATVSEPAETVVHYQWQESTDVSFTNPNAITNIGTDSASYTVQEGDEGQSIRVIVTATDADNGGVSIQSISNPSLLTLDNSSITVAAISALNGVVQGQQLSATATITGDADDAGATISYQWQVSGDGGTTWSNTGPATSGSASNVPASFYQLTEADEGMLVRVVASFTDDSGQVVSAASAATVVVAEIAPVITVPFSYAVDELMIVKNGTQMFDDTFASAPPFATPVTDPAGSAPVNFATLGSTWSDINSKAIMASSGAALIGGAAQVIARFNTNTQPQGTGSGQSELGLKQDAAFTVSGKFDLSAPSPVNAFYGIDLTDAAPGLTADQVVQLVVAKTGTAGGGTYAVELIKANQQTGTSTVVASQSITALMASNTQIQLDLTHATAGDTFVGGTYELFNNGVQTGSGSLGSSGTGTIFSTQTYTRAEILAFEPQTAIISGLAQEGQTLTAHAAANDADATLHYQWQSSADGSTNWTAIAGAADNSTYTLQPSDDGRYVRVQVSSSDPDGANKTVFSGATAQVSGVPVTVSNVLVNGQSAGVQPHEGDTLTGTATASSGAVLHYQWQESSDVTFNNGITNIGTDSASYTVQEADEGQSIRVIVTAMNGANQASATSNPTLVALDVIPTLSVSVSGNVREGSVLTATPTIGTDADGGSAVTYQWQSSTDGTNWSDIAGANGQTYTALEQDEGAQLRAEAWFTDDTGQTATTTSAATAAVVDNSSITVAAISALNGVVQGQQLSATATITGDADDAGATISYQWQVSGDGGTTWSNTGPATSGSASNVPASFYQLTEADEGMLVRVVASFTDDSGQVVSAASAATVVVAEIAPVITVPFSYAVDELMIVKNGTQMFDDTFASAPPFATPVTDPAGSAPVNFATLGSTWSDINSKAIMASSGAALIGGGAQVIARFNTNTQPQGSGAGQSELGLKQDAAFTVSGKFDLSAPSPVNAFYGIDLTDGSPSRNPADQVVQLVLKKTSTTGGGTYAVQLIQNNQATNTVNILAQQDITAQMAGNTQIEFDLSHAANGTAITGAFELFNNGTQTAATTFAPTGTIFTNGVTYTRAEILAFAPQAATISGLAQDGQTLTANAATNDADAVLHYQWQFSTNGGGTWTAIAGAADAKTYTLQESDEGHQIRVAVNSTDADGNTSATVTSGATSGVTDQPTTITNLLVNGVSAGLQPHEGDTLTATATVSEPAETVVHYQWQESTDVSFTNPNAITNIGTDSASYTVQEGDEGQSIRVIVTATDADNGGVSIQSISNPSLLTLDAVPSLSVSISGAAQEGATLTATPTVGTDADGGNAVTYQWQSFDGVNWNEIANATGLTYTVQETDEGAELRVSASFVDDTGQQANAFSSATTAVVDNSGIAVSVSVPGGNPVQQGQQLAATVTITGDADDTGATISYQWQVSGDGGTTWTNTGPATSGSASNVPASFYQLTEADEGKLVRVVASFTDDSGQVVSAASAPTVAVTEIAPVITVPFSYAVDELMIVKNGTQMFDDTFASAPPFATPVTDPAGSAPVNFATLGSTWSDINSKAIMASSGAALIGGGAQVIARFNTNTQPQGSGAGQSELGLKQDAAFTVSGKFDLSTPSPVNAFYGIDLTDGSPSRNPADQVVQLVLKKTSTTGGGTYAVQLIQNNQATNTVNILAQQDITAQMAGNTQIEFDLSHAANGTAITGAFELFNNGTQTAATTFTPTGTIFTGGVTYTRAEILAFEPQAATISGLAQDGQTLTANAATNDADATLHYQWQSSPDNNTWTAIAGAADAKTYTLQESDEGSFIRVRVNTADGDASQSATVFSGATAKVADAPPSINVSVSGDTQPGVVLSANAAVSTDTDGGTSIQYQWQASADGSTWNNIAGASAQTYTVADTDVGSELRVQASFSDDTGLHASAASAATAAVTGGTITVADGATVEIGGASVSSEVQFEGSTGTLQLDYPTSFTGTVAGFGAQDQMDLIGFDPNTTTLGYSANADHTSWTLTATDASHSANIALLGDYAASSFAAASDGHGGVVITDPPPLQNPLLTQPHA